MRPGGFWRQPLLISFSYLMDSANRKWFYSDGEKVFGPLPEKAIRKLVANGNIGSAFFLTRTDNTDWRPVAECMPDAVYTGSSELSSPPFGCKTQEIDGAAIPPPPKFFEKISNHVTTAAGIEKLEGFSLRELFSEVFSNHSLDEVEEEFSAGSRRTTPEITEIDISWPKPWIFLRMLGVSLAVYFTLVEVFKQTGEGNFIPAVIIAGAFAIPISTLVFFFEVNIRRNVSLFRVLLLFLVGGLASLVIAMPLFILANSLGFHWLNASVAGPVEETAKILAVFIFARAPRFHYIHNGLLFGAAVGTGFAAFETAGYALGALAGQFPGSDFLDLLQVRGPLSPFGHIVWTSIGAAALWNSKGQDSLKLEHLFRWKFLRVFAISIALHMIWNSGLFIPFAPPYVTFFLIGLIAWIIVLGFVQAGIREVRDEAIRHSR